MVEKLKSSVWYLLSFLGSLRETLRESYLAGSCIKGLEEVVLVTEDCLWQCRE